MDRKNTEPQSLCQSNCILIEHLAVKKVFDCLSLIEMLENTHVQIAKDVHFLYSCRSARDQSQ